MPRLKPGKQKRHIMISPSDERSIVPPKTRPLDPNQNIRITYVQQSQLENFLSAYQNHVLALIDYGRIQPALLDTNVLSFSVNMPFPPIRQMGSMEHSMKRSLLVMSNVRS